VGKSGICLFLSNYEKNTAVHVMTLACFIQRDSIVHSVHQNLISS